MPAFNYVAADRTGKKIKARADAQDETSLKGELVKQGLIPLAVSAVERKKGFTLQRITSKDVLVFTQELGSLLESGLPLDRALLILSEHTEKESLKAIIKLIYIDIHRGQSLSSALSKHKLFPRLYVNMIKAGEVGGILEVVVKRLSSFLETTVKLKEEIVSALIYPALLTAVGGLAVLVLMAYVVPKFSAIFADIGQPLPLPTLVLMKASEWITSYWWLMAAIAGATALLLISYASTAEGRYFMDGLKLKIPVVNALHMKFVIARFSRTLGTLLQSGVPILEALKVSRDVVGNEVMSEKLQSLDEGVKKGRGVAAPLGESGVFPPIVVQMIAVGEEAGKLEDSFLMVADRFETESRNLIKRTVGILEPAMILLMGLAVGFIVISMLMAVFSIYEIPV